MKKFKSALRFIGREGSKVVAAGLGLVGITLFFLGLGFIFLAELVFRKMED